MISLSPSKPVKKSLKKYTGTSIAVEIMTINIIRLFAFIFFHENFPVNISFIVRKNSFIIPHIVGKNAINTASRVPRCRITEVIRLFSPTFIKCCATDK